MRKTTNSYAIKAANLNLYYGETLAVSDINLEIEKQKITAMIGPSGCGKKHCFACVQSHE